MAATDTNSLYELRMGSDPRGGITQSGSSGSFTYSVKENMGNKPVNFVSFFDAMRFTNWLENGQPMGMQTNSTTESGVYIIGTGFDEVRNMNATYFLPTNHEWHKAAFHKNDGVTGNYFDYATSSDTEPTIATSNATGDINNPGANVANYLSGADWNGQDGNVTSVGSAGAGSASPYGTFDQNGNVSEWNEHILGPDSVVRRGTGGGGWNHDATSLHVSKRSWSGPTNHWVNVGFRVTSSVPEPNSLLLATLGALGILLRRKR